MTLVEIEKERKKVINNFFWYKIYVALSVFFTLGFFYSIVVFQFLEELINYKIAVYVIVILFIFLFLVGCKRTYENLVHKKSANFRNMYKEMYLMPYLLEKNIKYQMIGHINAVDIIKSRIFPRFSHQSGNDMIIGEKNGVNFIFSDLILEDKNDVSDMDYRFYALIFILKYLSFRYENLKEHLFTGIFFIADFNKNIGSNTFVMQKSRPRESANLSIVKMDNEIFNTKFKVYTDNIQNAFYLLSPALMERIEKLSNRFACPINISFLETKIYISINTNKDNFEADIHKHVVKQDPANTLIKDLEAVLGIVEILALDSNLWAKVDIKGKM